MSGRVQKEDVVTREEELEKKTGEEDTEWRFTSSHPPHQTRRGEERDIREDSCRGVRERNLYSLYDYSGSNIEVETEVGTRNLNVQIQTNG